MHKATPFDGIIIAANTVVKDFQKANEHDMSAENLRSLERWMETVPDALKQYEAMRDAILHYAQLVNDGDNTNDCSPEMLTLAAELKPEE